jgi:hypothetical protein
MTTFTTIDDSVKLLFDVLKLLPGTSEIVGLEPVVVDGLTLTDDIIVDVKALVATPEWADLVGKVKPLFEAHGGTVTLAPGSQTTVATYVAPPALAGGHPDGANRGGLMAPDA